MDFIAHPSRFSSSFSYSFGNIFERVKDFCNFAISAIIGNVFSAIFTFFFALGEFCLCHFAFLASVYSLCLLWSVCSLFFLFKIFVFLGCCSLIWFCFDGMDLVLGSLIPEINWAYVFGRGVQFHALVLINK